MPTTVPADPPAPAQPSWQVQCPPYISSGLSPRLMRLFCQPSDPISYATTVRTYEGGYTNKLHLFLRPPALTAVRATLKAATAPFRAPWTDFVRAHGRAPEPILPAPTEETMRVLEILEAHRDYDFVRPLAQISSILLREDERYFNKFLRSRDDMWPSCESRLVPRVPKLAVLIPKNGLDPFSPTRGRQIGTTSVCVIATPRTSTTMQGFHVMAEESQRDRLYVRQPGCDLVTCYPDAYDVATDEQIDALVDSWRLNETNTFVVETPDREITAIFLHDLFRVFQA